MRAKKLVSEKDRDEGNILFALEYLASEAKRQKSDRLLLILETALALATSEHAREFLEKNVANDDDTVNATYFLLRFLQAPNEVQKEILEIIGKEKPVR